MTFLAPPIQRTRHSRTRITRLHRLLRHREELADRIAAYRSHGLPTIDLWVALVRFEDHLRATYPRAYATHLPTWLQRPAPGAHPVGGQHPACPLCATGTEPGDTENGEPR